MTEHIEPPAGLLCELLAAPEKTTISTAKPHFSWVVPEGWQGAWQIQVFAEGDRPLWDSGKVESGESVNVPYGGPPLQPDFAYQWRVRTWDGNGAESPFSEFQAFRTGGLCEDYRTACYPIEQTEVAPTQFKEKAPGHWFADFGRAAFGTIRLKVDSPEDGCEIQIHLGERLETDGTIDSDPPGTIRYRKIPLCLKKGRHNYTLTIPPDERNTGPGAILMPAHIGEVLPFRYCEIEGASSPVRIEEISQLAAHYPFDDQAAHFESSDGTLNAVWEMCKYTVKATSFCGVYVDGDRERIPYEGDAYINQLCHYGADREFSMARHSLEYLLCHPTWPTEWQLHCPLMAWEDYMHTGDARFLESHFEELAVKTLQDLAREDGLIRIESEKRTPEFERRLHLFHEKYIFPHGLKDIVDWPPGSFMDGEQGERDNHEMRPVNTVVNAFHAYAMRLMAKAAGALSRQEQAQHFSQRAEQVKDSINRLLFDSGRGVYVDGEGSEHASLHSNMWMLAFELVPPERIRSVLDFVLSRGMACSVYGAQYLMEALYRSDADEAALDLMTARHDRGWWNMLQVGSSVALEAWDLKYKSNLDWNHAWGAVPGNIIPRFLMGIRPLEPGFRKVLVQPMPGTLEWFDGTVPTIRGPIHLCFELHHGVLEMWLTLPGNMTAHLIPPWCDGDISLNGKVLGDRDSLRKLPPGEHYLKIE